MYTKELLILEIDWDEYDEVEGIPKQVKRNRSVRRLCFYEHYAGLDAYVL